MNWCVWQCKWVFLSVCQPCDWLVTCPGFTVPLAQWLLGFIVMILIIHELLNPADYGNGFPVGLSNLQRPLQLPLQYIMFHYASFNYNHKTLKTQRSIPNHSRSFYCNTEVGLSYFFVNYRKVWNVVLQVPSQDRQVMSQVPSPKHWVSPKQIIILSVLNLIPGQSFVCTFTQSVDALYLFNYFFCKYYLLFIHCFPDRSMI